MPSQNRGFHSISGLWPLSAVAAFFLLIPALALGQEERQAPRAVPRVPIYDPGTPVMKKVLKNGVTLLVQEQRTSERVAGAVAVRMGAVYESDDDAGRGQVLIKSMTVATRKLPATELALRLLAADARIESGAGTDLGQISITSKREQVDQAIDLLSQVVLQPDFPDTAVEASRQRALTAAAEENENPLKAAYSMYLATMFRGSPLARPISGTVSGIADCRKKDLVALHRKYFAGGNMVVCFVGNLDGNKVMAQLEKAFAAASAGKALEPVPGPPVPLAADTTVTAERDMPSAVMTFGYPAPGYTEPDYAAFKIIEYYLSSPDRSPIAYWMRQRGQSTVVGVIFPPYPKRSSIAVYLGAPPSRLQAARDTVAAVMGRLKTQPLDDGEWAEQLKRVQNSTFANQNDPLVRARAMSQFEAAGVGYEFQRHFEEALLKLNPESLRETAARWFTHSSEAAITPVRNESKL